jgi:hypothetical protein
MEFLLKLAIREDQRRFSSLGDITNCKPFDKMTSIG